MESKPCVKKVAIIGAGPCGLATAIGLRSKGIDAQIYERSEEFKPAGVAIVLSHNGTYALRAIIPDIIEELSGLGDVYQQFVWKSITGEVLKAVPMNAFGVYDTPTVLITWQDLTQALYKKLPKENIHLNHQFTHLEENDDGVKIWFSNGENVQADIIIGADGLNSTVRKFISSEKNQISYVGQMSWQGLIPYSDKFADQHVFYCTLTPDTTISWASTGKYIYWAYFKISEKNKHHSKSDLLAHISSWPEPILSIIKEADEENIIERPLYEVTPLDHWKKNNIAIAGDAVHALMPSLGQGTSLSFEDAYEMTRCLSSYSTVQEALSNYEKHRKERITCIQQYSEEIKKRLWSKSQTSEQVSNEYNKLFSDKWFFQWLYNYKVDKDYNTLNPLSLKK